MFSERTSFQFQILCEKSEILPGIHQKAHCASLAVVHTATPELATVADD